MNNKNVSFWLCALAIMALSICSCTDRQPKVNVGNSLDSVLSSRIDTVPSEQGPDQTLYGKGGNFGMSTFVLVAEDGKKYDVTRVSDQGEEGLIYGSVAPGGHYALLLDESGDSS